MGRVSGARACAALLAAGMLCSASGHSAEQSAPDIITVELRELGAVVPVGGSVVPVTEVTLAAQFPGRVEFIAGEEGAAFKSGDLLIRLDEEELYAQRQAAQAQIANAQATVRNAGVQYERELREPQRRGGMGLPMMDQMMPGGRQSKVERGASLYSYGTQVEQARASLIEAESRLREIDARLKDARSVAPFAGVILKKFVNLGQTVQPGQPLLAFGDVRDLRILADIPARLALGLRVGDELGARLDDPARTELTVRVAQVFPMADPTRHTIRAKFGLPADAPVAPGMFAQVLISDPGAITQRVPVVPVSAVVLRGGLPMVYIAGADDARELRLLRLGEQVDKDNVVVLTGLAGGERIVTNPSR